MTPEAWYRSQQFSAEMAKNGKNSKNVKSSFTPQTTAKPPGDPPRIMKRKICYLYPPVSARETAIQPPKLHFYFSTFFQKSIV